MPNEELDDTALRAALDEIDDKTAAVRLLVAIAHQNGVTQSELAEWLDVERKTIYNWLSRFRDSPENLVGAARDDDRSGRPRKLTGEALTDLLERLRDPPTESGVGGVTWTPESVQRWVEDEHGITYSLESCRRLMRDAGLEYRRIDEIDGGQFRAEVPDEAVQGKRWVPVDDEE